MKPVIIDICFFNHIRELSELRVYDFKPLIKQITWGYTPQLLTEYLNYDIFSYIPRKDGSLIHVTKTEIQNLEKKDPLLKMLDIADRSQLVAGKRDNVIILTDDDDLLIECIALNIPAFSLPAFCLILVENSMLTKKECYRILHYFEQNGWFAVKLIKKAKNKLQGMK